MRRALATAALLVACGSQGPARPDAGGIGDAGEMLTCEAEPEAVARVLRPRCADADCHDADRPKADLDLVTPGVTARILGRRSIHEACADRELVTPGVPQGSFLFDKLLAQEGPCGDPMPLDAELPLAERRCLAEWVAAME